MAYNQSPLAFDDLRSIFDRALAEERGISVTCRSHAEAMRLRTRLHYLREKDRRSNKDIYPPDHTLHKWSAWDKLVCRVPKAGTPNEATLFIEKRHTDHLIIEPIQVQRT